MRVGREFSGYWCFEDVVLIFFRGVIFFRFIFANFFVFFCS